MSESKNIEYKTNEQFYLVLINLIKKELEINNDEEYNFQWNHKKEKILDEIKFKFKKKEIFDKKMELMENILPKYLFDKLKNLK